MLATGVGGPVGIALIGAGADTIMQKATTGEVNWGQVAVTGVFSLAGGGLVAMAGNALEGTAESIASYTASGAPLTPAGLITTAASGAAISVGTMGVMSKVNLPTPNSKLGNASPVPQPPVNQLPSSGSTFVVTPGGTAYDIPAGWTLREADNGKGLIAQHPDWVGTTNSGGNTNSNMIRIMDSNPSNTSGYSRYSNDSGQWLDPSTGKSGPKQSTHISPDYQGEYLGWPQ